MRTTGLLFGVALVVFVIVGFLGSAAQALPTPVFEFKFDETGVGAANTGSAGSSSDLITDKGVYSGATNYNLKGQAGPSGAITDNALDTSPMVAGLYPGEPYCPNFRVNSPNVGGISGLQTATWSGWFNTSEPFSTSEQKFLMSKGGWSTGFQIRTSTSTADTLEVMLGGTTSYGTTSFDVSSVFEYDDNGIWQFWAVTYDGSLTSNNLKLYWGGVSTSVAQVGTTQTADRGTLSDTSSNDFGLNMNIGVDYVAGYSVDGLTDNARIFDSVLSAADLETLRSGDAIPEPATLLLVGTAALGLLGVIRRRRMK